MINKILPLLFIINSLFVQAYTDAWSPTVLTKVTPDGGVAISSVMCIEEDMHGLIWFGTNNGLFNYDSKEIKKYTYSQYEKNTLPTNRINQIYNDNERLIIVTERGLCQYRPDYDDFVEFNIIDLKGGVIDGDFSFLTQTKDGKYWVLNNNGLLSFNTNFVSDGYVNINNNSSRPRLLNLDEQGNLWVIFHNGEIYYKTPDNSEFIYFSTGIARLPRAFYADQQHVWIGYSQHGLHCYDINGQLIAKYEESNGFIDNNIRSIIEADDGNIWVGTYNGIAILNGLNIIKTINSSQNPELPHHSVWSMYRDSKNTIWLGTWLGGLSYYSKYKTSVIKQNQHHKDYNVDDDIITSFAQDPDLKHIWISTASGQLKKYNLKTNSEEVFQVQYDGINVLTIKTIAIDKEGTIWLGTYEQGILYKKKDESDFHRLKTRFSLGLQTISILPVDDGLWVSDYQQGVFFLSTKNNKTTRYRHNALDSTTISNNSVRKIIEDQKGNIWFATEKGLNVKLKGSKKFTRISHRQEAHSLFSYDFIYTIIEDSHGDIWIGSNGAGLIKWDTKDNTYTKLTKAQGLPADDIYSIIEDTENNLWLATGNGICKYNTKTDEIRTYENIENITQSTFNANSGLLAADGRLFWGTTNGYISFDPKNIDIKNTRAPKTTITNFYINNKEVLATDDNNILSKSISSTKNLTLKYKHSLFSFKFVADNFINPEENRFKFRLHNFNEEWIETDFNELAIFTNIPPGKYVFEVRASNNDGVWNNESTQINIEITPPIWKTWYAYSFYILVLGLFLYYISKEIINQGKLKEQIRLEKVKSESEENLHQMKLQFFTNISHEFRTPLTLIMGPVERLLANHSAKDSSYNQLQIIKNNSERLLRLINQVLDFRKINAGKLKLKPINNDIIAFSKNIFNCFNEHARHRHFKYNFQTSHNELLVDFDPEKLDKIIYNLLSNAFKYCRDKGSIEMRINGNVEDFSISNQNQHTLGETSTDNYVEIIIADTGHGISSEHLPKIFERFQQLDESKMQSSGIGLNLTKDYIQLHNGKLRVVSTVNQGSAFSILLPTKQESLFIGTIESSKTIDKKDITSTPLADINKNISINIEDKKDQALILIVEDNLELLNYLKSSLGDYFRIARAKNGVEGVQKVLSLHPDLVISDVMMPEMNGIEFCETIKKDIQTSHTPFILLTALESIQDQITGLESGADAYISKPFSFNLLMAHISNLLNSRKQLKEAFKNNNEDKWENHIDSMDMDKKLIIKAIDYIESNLSNSDISVDDLADTLHLSRTTLHRKLKSLTGQSATEFIRGVRLKNAAKHILSDQYKVNEVAFMVGFNSLNYFTRSFKNYYGMSPRDYIKHNKQ